MKKIVTLGSATVDILVSSPSFEVVKSHEVEGGIALCQVYGGKIGAETVVMETGGGATNVGLGLKKQGFLVRPISVVGDDEWGSWVKGRLREDNLEVDWIKKVKGETGMSVILVAPDGGRSIITRRGVSKEIHSKDIDWDMIKGCDWVQISSLGGRMGLLEDAVLFSQKNGVKVGLNPGKRELEEKEKLISLMPKLELIVMNHMEAVSFWGGRYGEDKEMAWKFLKAGVKRVAITDGKKGAGISDEGRWLKVKGLKIKAVDDTGAGDGFTAGMVGGILLEKEAEEVLKRGIINGASVVTKLGAKDGLLTERQMTKWLKKRFQLVDEKL